MIAISHLSKQFGKQTVLHDVSITFEDHTIYGLIGPNGCGKTTLMRCICGFTKPTDGTVTVDGKVIGKDCDFAPSTGIIIETPGFLPHNSAWRNLAILAGISGKADKARIDEVIRLVGLDPNDKKPVSKYSLGMRQRWASPGHHGKPHHVDLGRALQRVGQGRCTGYSRAASAAKGPG